MECEVAKTLVEYGFAVDADYAYSREDGGVEKDFSVDIRATGYPPYRRNSLLASVELLVECKHRHRGNKWLFFPDPNEPDMSPFGLGHTLRAVDRFSWHFLPRQSTVSFDQDAIFCLKGVEIDTSNGSVHDSEIKHGLLQLQYALPRLLTDSIRFNVQNGEEDSFPFFFSSILLTTSSLLVADRGISMSAVEAADSLEQIAKPAPWVVVHSDSTPDFERHRSKTRSPLATLAKSDWVARLDDLRRSRGEEEFWLPSTRCAALAARDGERFFEYFSQSVVCSYESFPALIQVIKNITNKAAKARRDRAPAPRRRRV